MVTCKTCSPSEIYQLISRIRWPLNQRVHVLVMDNASNVLPCASVDEMKLRLMHGVKSTDAVFQNLAMTEGLLEHRGEYISDFTRLDVQRTPPELLRQLASEERLYLVYEPNDFLSLLAWARFESEKFRDSEKYLEEFKRLVSLNGGTCISPSQWTIRNEETRIKCQQCWLKGVRQTGRTRESWTFSADLPLNDDQRKKITDLVKIDDAGTQLRFLQLMRYFKDLGTEEGPNPRFVRQIEKLFGARQENTLLQGALRIGDIGRVASTHTVTLVELCLPVHGLMAALDLTFNLQSCVIEGSFTKEFLESERFLIVERYQQLFEVQKKIQPDARSFLLNPNYSFSNGAQKTNFYRNLRFALNSVFNWLGFAVKDVYARGSRKHEYYLDQRVSKLRYAMTGCNCDTFDPTTNEQAFLYFAEKYL